MCPQQPHRTVWVHAVTTSDGKTIKSKSSKCDLCTDTPYWNEKGGIGGKQACVESCPMKAIKFVAETPDQTETNGYDVKLRNEHWFKLGFSDEDKSRDVAPPAMGGFGGFGGGAPKIPAAKPKE
jgi:protein NrfC